MNTTERMKTMENSQKDREEEENLPCLWFSVLSSSPLGDPTALLAFGFREISIYAYDTLHILFFKKDNLHSFW